MVYYIVGNLNSHITSRLIYCLTKHMIDEIKKLKQIRKKFNITQQQLATQLNISISTITRWESGNSGPSNLALNKIRIFLKSKNHKSKSKKHSFIIIILLLLSSLSLPLYTQSNQEIDISGGNQDMELARKESALSQKIETQLDDLFRRYYKQNTYVIDAKVHLEKIPAENKTKQAASAKLRTARILEEEPFSLPGLPVAPPLEVVEPPDQETPVPLLQPADKCKISYIDLIILLDEKLFSLTDLDFIKSIAKMKSSLDDARGDTLIVKTVTFPVNLISEPQQSVQVSSPSEQIQIVFPLPLTALQSAATTKDVVKEIYPYLFFGGGMLLLLLFTIILIQVLSISKIKQQIALLPSAGINPMMLPQMQQGKQKVIDNFGKPVSQQFPPIPQAPKEDNTRNDLFYELRQLMVTTLVGNPQLSVEIFGKWIETGKDDGTYQVAAFLKATDSGLLNILKDHFGKETASQIEFAISQMSSIDKEGVIETFKRFREEFQREQQMKSVTGGNTTEVNDLFQFLRQLEPQQLYHIVKDEQPGIIAIVLAQLNPESANIVLQELPADVQSKIPVEMGKLRRIPVSAYKEIAVKLSKKAMDVDSIKFVTTDGVNALIRMLEQSTPEIEQQIIDRVTEQDLALAQEIRKYYITFDEITRIPDKVLAEVLRAVDRDNIIKALVNSKDLIKNKIINNLAPRTKIIVTDAIKSNEEEIPAESIYESRHLITQKIRDLAKAGKLDLQKLFV